MRHRSSIQRTIAIVLALGASTAALPLARAQPARETDKKKVAKSYVDAGLAAQDAGDYETALTFYGKAYELVPHPVLLFNMAQVHRLAGRPTQALELYEQYLAADPKGPQAKTAHEFVIALKNQVAIAEREAEVASRADAERQAAEVRRAEDAQRAAEAARKAEGSQRFANANETAPPAEIESTHVSPSASGRGLRITGLATGGAGVVALGVGTYFGLKARSLSNELSEPGAPYDPQKEHDGKSHERNMIILTSVGAALVIGGGVTYWLGHRRGAARGVALAPVWNGGPGLAIGGEL